MSSFFQLYQQDFGTNEREMLQYLSSFLEREKKEQLEKLLQQDEDSLLTIIYKENFDSLLNPNED